MFNNFMQIALEEAREAFNRQEVPIGAVVVYENKVVAQAGNQVEALNDPTAHAEMLAIRTACNYLGEPRLPECDLYVTLEPCPMCAQAISFARIRRLYFAAPDKKMGGVEHGPQVFSSTSCHHKPEVYSGIGEKESVGLLQEFFQLRRP